MAIHPFPFSLNINEYETTNALFAIIGFGSDYDLVLKEVTSVDTLQQEVIPQIHYRCAECINTYISQLNTTEDDIHRSYAERLIIFIDQLRHRVLTYVATLIQQLQLPPTEASKPKVVRKLLLLELPAPDSSIELDPIKNVIAIRPIEFNDVRTLASPSPELDTKMITVRAMTGSTFTVRTVALTEYSDSVNLRFINLAYDTGLLRRKGTGLIADDTHDIVNLTFIYPNEVIPLLRLEFEDAGVIQTRPSSAGPGFTETVVEPGPAFSVYPGRPMFYRQHLQPQRVHVCIDDGKLPTTQSTAHVISNMFTAKNGIPTPPISNSLLATFAINSPDMRVSGAPCVVVDAIVAEKGSDASFVTGSDGIGYWGIRRYAVPSVLSRMHIVLTDEKFRTLEYVGYNFNLPNLVVEVYCLE